MRTLPLAAAGLLVGALLAGAPTYAAGEECQGRPATVVGQPLQTGLVGTAGDDVVVTNGAIEVDMLGGDDLVCVTEGGGPAPARITTGTGDDVVDASRSRSMVEAVLGAGADSFVGAPEGNVVRTGPTDGSDTDRDVVVSTSAGGPYASGDEIFSGTAGVPNGDDLRLTRIGSDVSWGGPMTDGARLEVGIEGTLLPTLGSGAVAIDTGAGTITEDGATTLRWTGSFVRLNITGRRAPRSLDLTGSGADEYVYTSFSRGHGKRAFDLGGGDDFLLSLDGMAGDGSSYVGGPGEDEIHLWGGKRLAVDLATRTWAARQGGRAIRGRVGGWEQSRFGADRLDLRGTARPDDLRFYACTATVHGRGGSDTLASSRPRRPDDQLACSARGSHATILGGRGRDTIVGSKGRDLLVGGLGRDRIDGDASRDRCSGERLKRCEVRSR